ncbi:MAG TPA: EamA family transporter [Chthonomonas sp.]|uniref:EamA family transporter n=1 Tax=Chthonomonas sp. TaxID=2282153 RepID=UPI002B4AF440|nr:EamA family transporter [Chthonomonas sp.]HLI48461.1 EamA family transporter [Chthonomonas sp.]
MSPLKWKAAFITFIAVFAISFGEAMLSRGMKQIGDGTLWHQIGTILHNHWVIVGTTFMAAYFFLYMWALKMAPFSFVLPITALSYPLGGFLATTFLREHVGPLKWLGYAAIVIGVILVGLGEANGK